MKEAKTCMAGRLSEAEVIGGRKMVGGNRAGVVIFSWEECKSIASVVIF